MNIKQNQVKRNKKIIKTKITRQAIKLKAPRNIKDENEQINFKKQNLNVKVQKYFSNRYNFFNKFDSGILLDEESWYSVTPENIAQYISNKYKNCKSIADLCCGCGGNSIQFALNADKVISIDIDKKKLCYLMNNAKIYNVQNKIYPLQWNAQNIKNLKVDLAFSSPPWGGINYQNKNFDLLKYQI